MSTTASSSSPLLKLPPELRNKIYGYAILRSGVKKVHSTDGSQPPLLRVCKEIRSEAVALYYTDNKFYLCIDSCNVRRVLGFRKALAKHFSRPAPHLCPADFDDSHGIIGVRVDGAMEWERFVEWVELFWAGEMFGVPGEGAFGRVWETIGEKKAAGWTFARVGLWMRRNRAEIEERYARSQRGE
ncbi:hypothetical protein LTR09_008441 [Extremus antarcticus]|uniref:2EXR domain-containing protein n=1 Tax=Extremus antarcticus TaxID=702011 RepID=A0AAJ0DHD8_9PEZI|nr:hypothetical protein LTR09_008441 [Extremus antarcticus]